MSSVYTTGLKAVILAETIGRIQIFWEGGLFSFPLEKDTQKIFLALYYAGIFSEDEIKEVLHKRILDSGRGAYDEVLSGVYPDHSSSPESLGYLMKHSLTPKEISRIHFDHGEKPEDYLKKSEGFLDVVFKSVIKPIPEESETVKLPSFIPCADGGPCTC